MGPGTPLLELAAVLLVLGALLTVPCRGDGGDDSTSEGCSVSIGDDAMLAFLVNK